MIFIRYLPRVVCEFRIQGKVYSNELCPRLGTWRVLCDCESWLSGGYVHMMSDLI